jgi:hypothetical protein
MKSADTNSYERQLIDELADICGIIPEFWDILGNKRIASFETKKAILEAMKVNVDSPGNIKEEIEKRKHRPWLDLVEPAHIISVNKQPFKIPVYLWGK